MDDDISKAVEQMQPLLKHRIIRIRHAVDDNQKLHSLCLDYCIILHGFTDKGNIQYLRAPEDCMEKHQLSEVLTAKQLCYTDGNWIDFAHITETGSSTLNRLQGKRVRRNKPTRFGDTRFTIHSNDRFITTLLWATPFHVMLSVGIPSPLGLGQVQTIFPTYLLGPDFADPDDWMLDPRSDI